MRRWWRQFWRKRTRPIPRVQAEHIKGQLSILYAFCAWNACGIMVYNLIKYRFPESKQEEGQPGRYYARLWQAEDVHVYKVKGLQVVGDYQIEGRPQLIPDENSEPKDGTWNITEDSQIELVE